MQHLIFEIYYLFLSLSPSSLSFTERAKIIQDAIDEAKAHAKMKEARHAAALAAEKKSGKGLTATKFLARGFKKPTQRSLINGKARLLQEDMVERAERKLLELKKSRTSASSQEMANVLAEELVHTPGSLLKEDEMAKINIEIECVDERRFARRCSRLLNVNTFRTITGVCNNLNQPLLGSSGRQFRRLIKALYEDGVDAPIGRKQAQKVFGKDPFDPPAPSARLVSASVISRNFRNEKPLTHVVMQWGQFLDHDLDLGPEIEEECESCIFTEVCEPIRVPPTDPKFGLGTEQNADCLEFRRAVPVCKPGTKVTLEPREQVNDLTSFIDGSMIYGSNREQERAVRLFSRGLLKTSPPPPGSRQRLMPRRSPSTEFIQCREREDCFVCGDIRCNEQYSLTVMHTIWVREHNRIANRLRSINRHWSDERIFQEARAIVGAVIQKITYFDYLPKILGTRGFAATIGPARGFNPSVNPDVPNSFATAVYRYGHSLIRPFFDRLGPGYISSPRGRLSLARMFFNPSLFEEDSGTDSLVRGWVTQLPRSVDEFLNGIITTRLFETNQSIGMDLASLNIQRSRDHGLPLYGSWRDFCRAEFAKKGRTGVQFAFQNPTTRTQFIKLYSSENFVDLWIAGLAERRFLDSVLGPTFACIFGITFSDVRDGDRFYFENRGVFTPGQLNQIRRQTLSRVLCDTSDNIAQIQPDAFRQFNDGQRRVRCSDTRALPRIGLGQWRETACYLRMSIPSVLTRRPSAILLARRLGKTYTYTNNVPGIASQCMPVPCPTSTTTVPVYAYPRITDYNACRFTSRLPSVQVRGASAIFFNRGLTAAQISNSNGFFRTPDACAASNVNAVTFTCSPTVRQAGLEKEDLHDADADPLDEPDSPDSLTEKPPGFDTNFAVLTSASDEVDPIAEDNEEESHSSMDELEEELHSNHQEADDKAKDAQTLSQEFLKTLDELREQN